MRVSLRSAACALSVVAGAALFGFTGGAAAHPFLQLDAGYTLAPANSSFVTTAGTNVSVPLTVTNTSAAPITIGNFFTQGAPSAQNAVVGVQGPQNLSVPAFASVPVVLQMFVPQQIAPNTYNFQICAGGSILVQCVNIQLVVNAAPDFSVSLVSVSTNSVVAGGHFTATVSVQSLNAYTGNVSFFIADNGNGSQSFGAGTCDNQGHCVQPSASVGLGQTVTTSFQVNVDSQASLTLHNLTVNACSGCGQQGVPPIQHNTASFPMTVTAAPDFSLSGSVSPSTVSAGGSVSATVTVTPINGFGGTVTFFVADQNGNGLPGFGTGTCDPSGCHQATITGGGTTTFQINVGNNVAPNTYNLLLIGGSGCVQGSTCVQHKLPFTLTVQAAPDFGLSLDSVTPTSVPAGEQFTANVTVSSLNNFNGTVSFGISDQNGNGVSFFPAGQCNNNGCPQFPTVTGSGSVALSIAIGNNEAPGTYNLFIRGDSGCRPSTPCIEHKVPFTITVLPALSQVFANVSEFTRIDVLGADLIGATDPFFGFTSWQADMVKSQSSPTVPGARIHIGGATTSLQPPVTFPVDVGPLDLVTGNDFLDLTLGNSGHPSDIATTGFDASRSASPSNWTLPPGGGTETVTVTVTPRVAYGDIQIQIAMPDTSSGVQATIDTAGVTTSGGVVNFQSVDSSGVNFDFSSTIGQTYTVTTPIHVSPGGVFKPFIFVNANSFAPLGDSEGPSVSIANADLGGSFDFSTATAVHWHAEQSGGVTMSFAQVLPPTIALSVDKPSVTIIGSGGFTENATVTSLGFSGQADLGLSGPPDANGDATAENDFFIQGPSPSVDVPTGGSASAQLSIGANGLAPGTYTVWVVAFPQSESPPVFTPITVTVLSSTQTITFGALAGHTFGDAPFTVSATGGASGNPVTFTASGNCSVSGVTVTITGPGSCTVTAYQAGNANYQAATPVSRSFAIADSAQAEKQVVLNRLNALLANATKHDAGKLSDAANKVADSLSGTLWVDANHLDPKHGNQVFDNEKAAWQSLEQLIGDKKTSIPDATLQALADQLVSIDRGLAVVALSDATAGGGDSKQLASARKELAAGDASAAAAKPDAIDHYKNAWNQAEQSVK